MLRKEIVLFYTLILVSAGVIIAAERPEKKSIKKSPPTKCCKLPAKKRTDHPTPVQYYHYYLTEGLLRLKA